MNAHLKMLNRFLDRHRSANENKKYFSSDDIEIYSTQKPPVHVISYQQFTAKKIDFNCMHEQKPFNIVMIDGFGLF